MASTCGSLPLTTWHARYHSGPSCAHFRLYARHRRQRQDHRLSRCWYRKHRKGGLTDELQRKERHGTAIRGGGEMDTLPAAEVAANQADSVAEET